MTPKSQASRLVHRPTIEEIKRRIHGMVVERGNAAERGTEQPSQYWLDFCRTFRYLMDLGEDSLKDLRIHTYHLTGDNYQTYYFSQNAERWRTNHSYDKLVDGLPHKLRIQEPESGIGFHYPDGLHLSGDIIRFQRVIRTLFREGVLTHLGTRTRPTILEVGGGYGGLAHHLHEAVDASTYIVVDLPETLLFSAIYLSQNNPDKRIYIYDPDNPALPEIRSLHDFDFVLLPNYLLDRLAIDDVDLVINIESLQEMTASQVEDYLAFIRRVCTGTFYSWNQRRNPRNHELDDLNAMIDRHFTRRSVEPPPTTRQAGLHAMMRATARRLGMLDVARPDADNALYESVCTPLPLA